MASLAVLPSLEAMEPWTEVEAARIWAGLEPGALKGVFTKLGDANLTSMPILASLPPSAVWSAVAKARIVSEGETTNAVRFPKSTRSLHHQNAKICKCPHWR